uniref:CSON014602 protein n=1 Tax=Culicoides sonorensis TaxID=179676 RepID=A0A336MDU8_CULSO
MAWGYWSATAIDRGRSPRRNTSISTTQVAKYPSQQSSYQQQQQQQQQQFQETQCPIGNSCPQAVGQDAQGGTVCNSPCQSPCQQSPCGSPCRSECRSMSCRSQCHSPEFDNAPPPPQVIQCTYTSRRQSLESNQSCCNTFATVHHCESTEQIKANQLSDIICRAVQPSIQSASNTLTRGSTLRGDNGDYAVPHPHPHTHHYMTTTSDTPRSLSRVGSCPGSTRGSIHGSNSGSSPGADIHSIHHGSHPSVLEMSSIGGGYNSDTLHSRTSGRSTNYATSQFEYAHYDRMPIPIPVQIPIVPPPPPMNLHSEEEIEPAYATGKSYIKR